MINRKTERNVTKPYGIMMRIESFYAQIIRPTNISFASNTNRVTGSELLTRVHLKIDFFPKQKPFVNISLTNVSKYLKKMKIWLGFSDAWAVMRKFWRKSVKNHSGAPERSITMLTMTESTRNVIALRIRYINWQFLDHR